MENIGQTLIRLHKAHRGMIAEKLSKLNLYPGQDGLLYHLSQNDGLTMTDLVEKLNIKHPTLFTMVNRMEKAGLIKKEKDNLDKRISKVFLTNEGKKQVSELSKVWLELERQLVNGFTEEEIIKAQLLLSKLTNNLTQID